jgi:hypothetical protein
MCLREGIPLGHTVICPMCRTEAEQCYAEYTAPEHYSLEPAKRVRYSCLLPKGHPGLHDYFKVGVVEEKG